MFFILKILFASKVKDGPSSEPTRAKRRTKMRSTFWFILVQSCVAVHFCLRYWPKRDKKTKVGIFPYFSQVNTNILVKIKLVKLRFLAIDLVMKYDSREASITL